MKNNQPGAADHRVTFGQWLEAELTARGYDLSGPRSGGKSKFAADSGISQPTVGRMLRDEGVSDTRVLGLLAEALRVPLARVLVRAGVLDEDELAAVRDPNRSEPLTAEAAADELGIKDEQSRRLFIDMTRTLQRQPPPGTGEANLAEQ
ncbi:XRE family transcriptional regulator [Streptomyces chryseus]